MTLEERAKAIADESCKPHNGYRYSETYKTALRMLQEACNDTISRCLGSYPSDGEMSA